MDNTDNIAKDLLVAIENNTLKLPTQPEVAVRIRDCVEDPNVTSIKLANVISRDPALTAKFIQIANGPLTRGAVQIDSLPGVISRLGLSYVSNVATGLAMEQIFQATNDNINDLMCKAWSSSTYVAALSHVISKHFSKIPPATASLGGLMHQIGILPILSYAQDHEHLAENKTLLIKIITEHHAKIGEAILKSWMFPPEIYSLPQQLYQDGVGTGVPTMVDILQAAMLKAQDMNMHLLETHIKPPTFYAQINAMTDENQKLKDNPFMMELIESIKFYCK